MDVLYLCVPYVFDFYSLYFPSYCQQMTCLGFSCQPFQVWKVQNTSMLALLM